MIDCAGVSPAKADAITMRTLFGLFRVITRIFAHPLNARHRGRAIVRFVKWQIGMRLVPHKAVIDWVDDARLIVGHGETGVTSNLYHGLAEYEDMAFLLRYLTPTDVFVDVGANAGAYTVLAAAVVGARVVAFEPIPQTAMRLMDQTRLNGVPDRVTLYRCAVGKAPGKIAMTRDRDTTNHVVSDAFSGADDLKVPVVTIDGTLQKGEDYVLKIDVEGFELAVLLGAREHLAAGRISAIIIELNGSGARYGIADEQVHAMLNNHGYKAIGFVPEARQIVPSEISLNGEGNVIYVRDIETARARCRTNTRSFKLHTAWEKEL